MHTRAESQHTPSRARHSERGSSVLEFALVLPVLLALILGIAEFGTMYFVWTSIDKASTRGARIGVTGDGYADGTRMNIIRTNVQEMTGKLSGFGEADIHIRSYATPTTNIARENNPGLPCELLEVEVLFSYHPFTPVVGSLLPPTIVLDGGERMINEPWLPCGEAG